MGIIKGGMFFVLGAASGVAVHRLWQRYSQETGKEGTQLVVQGVGAALAAGREMTRKAARFMEEVEDIVAEAQAGLDHAQATAATGPAAPVNGAPPPAAPEPSAPPNGAERV